MKWETLKGNTDIIWTDGALIPVYRLNGGEAVLIDTGTREDPELLAELARRGLRVRAILCTHLHPDHIANNSALIARDGAEVFAAAGELDTLDETYDLLRRTSALLGVPLPEPELPLTVIGDVPSVEVDGAVFPLLPTPGHTGGHLAIVTPDGVCCLGDAMVSEDQLLVSRLPYFEDVDLALETMEMLRQTDWPVYLTAHRGVTDRAELDGLVEINIRKELELYDALREAVTGPMEQERAVTAFMESIGLKKKAVESPLMRHTAEKRVDALVHAGEYRREGSILIPV